VDPWRRHKAHRGETTDTVPGPRSGDSIMAVDRPLPYSDIVPIDGIQDYLYRKTGTLIKKPRISRYVRSGAIRTITRPHRAGGGTFTRRAWLDEFIQENS